LVWAMHTYRSALGSPQVAREPAAAYAGLLQPSLPVAFNRRKTDRVPVQAPVQGLVSDVFTPKPMPIKASGGAFQSSMKLTERQSDVLGHLVRGKSNKRIAIELGITEGTVKIHLAAIFRALNVRNRTEAAIVASSLVSLI
jgi:DNA-binding NarL/FixJ family response regulator